ncbi:hypothetical protein MTO96_015215 [Rhipicephalus appendiculatus]
MGPSHMAPPDGGLLGAAAASAFQCLPPPVRPPRPPAPLISRDLILLCRSVGPVTALACTRKIFSTITNICQLHISVARGSSTPMNRYKVAGKVLTMLDIASIRNLRNNSPSSPRPPTRSIRRTRPNNRMPLAVAGLVRRRGKEASRLALNFRIMIW